MEIFSTMLIVSLIGLGMHYDMAFLFYSLIFAAVLLIVLTYLYFEALKEEMI